MTQFACSECKPPQLLSRCRVPGTVVWAWRCPAHGILHEHAAKSAPRAVEVPEGITVQNRAGRRAQARATPDAEENTQHGGTQKPHTEHRSSRSEP